MPPWIAKFLALLAVSGLLVTAIGLYQSATAADLVAGLGLTFIGLTGLGLAWGFKRHHDVQSQGDAERANERQSIVAQIRETKEAITRLDGPVRDQAAETSETSATGTDATSATGAAAEIQAADGDDHEQRVKQASERLGELQQLGAIAPCDPSAS